MSHRLSRRSFLQATGTVGAAAMTAASYSRVLGANARIRIGVIGCGGRGFGAHMAGVHKHKAQVDHEVVAVADPWRQRRERAAAKCKEWYGRQADAVVSYRDIVSRDDVDAVMIASPDHVHTLHLEAAAKAKKDIYCEKPLAMDLEKLNRACDAVRAGKVVFQAGTQLRSYPTFTGCRKLYRTGILGTVGRIEQMRNGGQPYWYSRVADVAEKDVEWKEFLGHRPMRPFDPVLFSGWYGYREFSDGPVPGLGSHFLDLIHYITGATLPTNAVCLGGTYTWNDKHKFTCPDHVHALWEYPEGFMVSYSTNFGNSGSNSFKILGDVGTLDMVNWHEPILTAKGGFKKKGAVRGDTPVESVKRPDHFLDWLQCLHSRKPCNADIDAAYQHAVPAIMAMKAFDTGQRQVFDRDKRQMHAG